MNWLDKVDINMVAGVGDKLPRFHTTREIVAENPTRLGACLTGLAILDYCRQCSRIIPRFNAKLPKLLSQDFSPLAFCVRALLFCVCPLAFYVRALLF